MLENDELFLQSVEDSIREDQEEINRELMLEKERREEEEKKKSTALKTRKKAAKVILIATCIIAPIVAAIVSGISSVNRMEERTTYEFVVTNNADDSSARWNSEADMLLQTVRGETVKFGNYFGVTDWTVYDTEGSYLKLVCNETVQENGLREGETPTSWEESHIRSWLNQNYFETAFSDFEQKMIVCSEVEYEGIRTVDSVSVLSNQEWQNASEGVHPVIWISLGTLQILYENSGAFSYVAEVDEREAIYRKALEDEIAGNHLQAYEAYKNIGSYRDSKQRAEALAETILHDAQIGDTVVFGSHQWDVVDEEDNKLLLLCQNAIGHGNYQETNASTNEYIDTLLYKTMDNYYREGLTEVEKSRVAWTDVSMNGNKCVHVAMFVLSPSEAKRYIHFSKTFQGADDGILAEEDRWWLREEAGINPEEDGHKSVYAKGNEEVVYDDITLSELLYRPAVWVYRGK